MLVPFVVTFRNTTPTPRVMAGDGAAVGLSGATIWNLAMLELNGAHTFGAVNGVNGALELTEWKPSFATAISGPTSIPHGWSRLRETATVCPPDIAVDPASLPSTAIVSHPM